MKRIFALLLVLVMVLSACGAPAANNGTSSTDEPAPATDDSAEEPATDDQAEADDPTGEEYTGPKELTVASSGSLDTMDYVITARTNNHEFNANFVDGLLENDRFGNLVGSIAESWEPNEDATVWTFHLRPDVLWVTSDGEEYGTVTAEDFVTGVRHGAEFNSDTAWLLQGILKGYNEYLGSDFSDAAWENVGIKAVDELTLEFTLEQATPYFDSMTTYTVLYPINRDFLESRGAGCAIGAPVKDDCQFGTVTPDSILYNGGYILTTNDVKSQIVLTKNPDYWDADNVFLDKVTYIYDEGQDPYSIMKGFEAGIYPQASLRTTWEDYQTYLDKYIDNAYYTIPNAYSFGVVFNYNRQIFDNTNYATDDAQKENTRNAILNVDFRRALRASIDLVKYLGVGTTEELAKGTIRNLNNFPEAGTQSDGTLYFDAVTKAYNEATGENRNLNDGEPTFFSKEEALAYIEKAKEAGVQFPVHLDMLVPETSDSLMKRGSAFKQTVSDNTDGQIIIELVTRPLDLVQAIAYENSDPAQADYDISTFTGWGPDYADPKSFVDTYSPTTGYYMTTFGLGTVDKNGEVVDKEIKEQVGFMEYEKLYREADAIVDDMDARYQAFAKADAYLVEQVLSIPTSMQARGQVVSKYVPFTGSFSNYGVSGLKYKGLKLQEEIVTVEERNAAEQEWNAGKGQ